MQAQGEHPYQEIPYGDGPGPRGPIPDVPQHYAQVPPVPQRQGLFYFIFIYFTFTREDHNWSKFTKYNSVNLLLLGTQVWTSFAWVLNTFELLYFKLTLLVLNCYYLMPVCLVLSCPGGHHWVVGLPSNNHKFNI